MNVRSISRRRFLAVTCTLAVTAGPLLAAEAPARRRRAAIIGHTGHGDYGHGLDVAFAGIPGVEVVAIADPDPGGRERAAKRAGAQRQFADYREMLEKEKPELVVIAPRWSEEHHAMAMAALKVGAHVLTEKPFTVTPAEADELLAVAARAKRKISVAHQMRLAPTIARLHQALHDGALGDLLQIRSWGKQDARAGGEDMLVLGTHVFDMMRLLAGDPLWCHACVLHKGREITRHDARTVGEKIGPVAGDEIEAQFGFPKGITATFTSRGRLRQTLGHWGMELLGTRGVARILLDVYPLVHVRHAGDWSAEGKKDEWRPIAGDATASLPAAERGFDAANRRLVEDWLQAIDEDREPQCSGHNAARAVEMVMAVYESALARRRIDLPLVRRAHPLQG